jgi:hypothetical protein
MSHRTAALSWISRHLAPTRRGGAAAAGVLAMVAAPPAWAEIEIPANIASSVYTGAQCSSEGPTVVSAHGTRENDSVQPANTSLGYQMFQCPIQMPYYGTPSASSNVALYVRVDGRKGSHPSDLLCRLAVSDGYGNDKGQSVFTGETFLALSANPPAPFAFLAPRAAHLRCRVYNRALSGDARSAIHSYRVAIL